MALSHCFTAGLHRCAIRFDTGSLHTFSPTSPYAFVCVLSKNTASNSKPVAITLSPFRRAKDTILGGVLQQVGFLIEWDYESQRSRVGHHPSDVPMLVNDFNFFLYL